MEMVLDFALDETRNHRHVINKCCVQGSLVLR